MPRHHRRHQTDRSGTGDEHVLRHHRELSRGVHRVAERVEDRRDVKVDLRQVGPQVPGGHDDVLGERAIALHADPDRVRAQRTPAGHAVAATPADDVSLGAHQLPHVNGLDALPELRHLTDELMAHHQGRLDRRLCPFAPGIDVEVGSTDAGPEHADQHLARRRRGFGHVVQRQTRRGFGLDERLHVRCLGTLDGGGSTGVDDS